MRSFKFLWSQRTAKGYFEAHISTKLLTSFVSTWLFITAEQPLHDLLWVPQAVGGRKSGDCYSCFRVWDGEPVAAIWPLGLRASSSASSSNWPLILLLWNPTPSQSLSLLSGWGWPTGAHHSFSRPQGWHGTWARPMTLLFYPVLGVELLRKRHFPLVNSIWKWNQYRGEQDDERPFSVTCTWI